MNITGFRGFLDHVVLIEACFNRFCASDLIASDTPTHICDLKLHPDCMQFWDSNANEKFDRVLKSSRIEAASCKELSERIHEYLKVFVQSMAAKSV